MKIHLRHWTLDDVQFSLRIRNDPSVMENFRQDKPLTKENQYNFIKKDLEDNSYNGYVIEANKKLIGLCGIKDSNEFTIALLPEYRGKGYAMQVMKELIKRNPDIWSEVFVGNPALEWFIKLGFKVIGVHERQYYKKGKGLIDVVVIKWNKDIKTMGTSHVSVQKVQTSQTSNKSY